MLKASVPRTANLAVDQKQKNSNQNVVNDIRKKPRKARANDALKKRP